MIDDWEKGWKEYADKVCERMGWIGSGLVIFGYYLNANEYVSSWLIWFVGNLCVAGYSAHKKAYPTLVMSLVIAAMNIYGFLSWSN
jgi:nicotinamide riboside transporter PnuC